MDYSEYSNIINKRTLSPTYVVGLVSGVVEDAAKSSIILTFENELNTTLPLTSVFTLIIPNKTITNASLDVSQKILTLTSSAPFVKGDAIIVKYTRPVINPLREVASGYSISAFEFVCTNNIIDTPSYINIGASGDRQNIITVTTDLSLSLGTINVLIDGVTTGNNLALSAQAVADKYIRFDFGSGNTKRITEANFYANAYSHGTWKWQASNNGINWTDIGNSFDLTGDNAGALLTELSGNANYYRYYQLLGVSGNTTINVYLAEFKFKIAGSAIALIDWPTIKLSNINLWLIPTGTKSAVATLTLTALENTSISITGTAMFYSDASGTLNASNTKNLTTGLNTLYIRCIDDSVLILPENKITTLGWTSPTNAPAIFRDLSDLVDFTSILIDGNNYVTADLTNLINLTTWYHTGETAITGNITNLTKLVTYQERSTINTVVANLTNHTDLESFVTYANGLFNGDITNLTKCRVFFCAGNNAFTGDISGWVNIDNSLEIYGGTSTFTGNVEGITDVLSIVIGGNTSVYGDIKYLINAYWLEFRGSGDTVLCSDWAALKECCVLYFLPGAHYLTAAETNAVLAGFWANRDEPHAINNERAIHIRGEQPTGQGLIDKAALEAYRTPNNDPTKDLWIVTITS